MARRGRGIPITPEQWMQQWEPLSHMFDMNMWEFTVKVGQEAVDIFKHSFDLKRFNSRGSVAWRMRSKENKGGNLVGSLVESGSLRNSIKYKINGGFTAPKKEIKVYTDPSAFGGTYSHTGFCFADVHNSDDPSVRTGHVARMPQRQFMPTDSRDSSVMQDKLRELGRIIFRMFPGGPRI